MSRPEDFTIGWICALKTEFAAAIALLDERLPDFELLAENDSNSYACGRYGRHNVAIAMLPEGQYGLSSAASAAQDMMRTLPNFRFGLMVGIGGGAPTAEDDIRLGDVVVSTPSGDHGGVLHYDLGKALHDGTFQRTSHMDKPPPKLRATVGKLRAKHEVSGHKIQQILSKAYKENPRLRRQYGRPVEEDTLYASDAIHVAGEDKDSCRHCKDNSSKTVERESRSDDVDDPAIFYGLVASGNTLMRDAKLRDKLARETHALCFEMEAAGLMNGFPCLVIRGICDYSDSHKSKRWQGYAAMTAAAYAKELLSQIAPSTVDTMAKFRGTIDGRKCTTNLT